MQSSPDDLTRIVTASRRNAPCGGIAMPKFTFTVPVAELVAAVSDSGGGD